MIEIPKNFEEKHKKILGKDYEKLVSCLEVKPRNSLRVNTLKIERNKLLKKLKEKGWKLRRIPWYENGFFVELEEKGELAKTLEYYLGYYYLQEASSMIPPLVLNPKKNEEIHDLCAAPGSKTTQIAQMMENEGVIVANDDNLKRIKALRSNLQRLGVMNTIVVYSKGEKFWKFGLKFDKILLDVPCSGSGTLISSFRVLQTWSQSLVKRLSALQKKLLSSAVKCLKKDGEIVYSTCSLEPEENEEVIDFGIRRLGLEVEEIEVKNLKHSSGLKEWNGKKFDKSLENAIRIYPFQNFTEGFFICKLRG